MKKDIWCLFSRYFLMQPGRPSKVGRRLCSRHPQKHRSSEDQDPKYLSSMSRPTHVDDLVRELQNPVAITDHLHELQGNRPTVGWRLDKVWYMSISQAFI